MTGNPAFYKKLKSFWHPSKWLCINKEESELFHVFGKLAREAIPSLQNIYFPPPSLHAIIPVFQECLFLDQVQEPSPGAHVLLPRPGLPASSNTPLQTVLPPLPTNCTYLPYIHKNKYTYWLYLFINISKYIWECLLCAKLPFHRTALSASLLKFLETALAALLC